MPILITEQIFVNVVHEETIGIKNINLMNLTRSKTSCTEDGI